MFSKKSEKLPKGGFSEDLGLAYANCNEQEDAAKSQRPLSVILYLDPRILLAFSSRSSVGGSVPSRE